MKKTSRWFATLVGCAALMGLSALPAFAATGGDIYEIRPCDAYGYSSLTYGTTGSNKPIASQAAPITASGQDVYFKLRLLVDSYTAGSKKVADDQATFSLVDIYGREITDPEQFLLNPLKIGIYVGGRPDAAEMITLPTPTLLSYTGSTARSKTMWDIVFHYRVQPADLGLPIKLAVRSPDNPNGVPFPENYDAEGSLEPATYSYQFYNDGYWKILYTPGEGRGTPRDAVMLYIADGEPSYSIGEQPESDAGFKNRSLSDCGFYTKTVDFSNGREELVVKKGHNLGGSVEIAGGTTATSARELYVWAVDKAWYDAVTNDPAKAVWKDKDALSVRVKDSAPAQVIVGYDAKGDPIKQYVYMTKVTIVGGTSRGNFTVYGQNFAEGQDNESVLILSSAPSFTWKKGLPNTPLLQDFSTTTAKCEKSEPELTLRRSETSKLVYNVTSNYSERVTTLNLTLSEPYTKDMTVTVTPKLVNKFLKAKYTWDKIVRVNAEQVEQGVVPKPDPVTVTIPAGKTIEEMPIYLYGMGASADQNDWSDTKGNEIDFTLDVEPEEAKAFLKQIIADNLYVVPDVPVLANAKEISEITVSSGEPEPVSMVLHDNYTDVTDTNKGYTVKALWWDDGEEPSDLKFRQNAFDLTTATSGISTFKPAANGILTALEGGAVTADDWPAIPADVRGQNLRIRINAPNAAQTAYHDIRVSVVTKPKAEASAYETKSGDYVPDSFPEVDEASEATKAYIGVDLESPNTSGGDLYAFLRLKDEEAQKDLVSGRCVISGGKASQGIRIRAKESKEYARGELTLFDGIQGGTLLEFDVILCTTKSYDEKKIYTKFDTSSPLEILVDNVKPKVNNISMSGWNLDESGKAFEGAATKDLDQYFTFDIGDAARDLEATGTEAFSLTYQFKGCSPKYMKSVTYKGNPADLVVTNKFGATGTCTLSVTLLDKDGGKTGPLSYTFEVTDKPTITISNREGITSFYEDESPEYQVKLSQNPSDGDSLKYVTVQLTVTPQATGTKTGEIKLAGDFRQTGANTYIAVYEQGITEHSFFVESADGTAGGASKFSFKAEVTTTDFVPGTETPCSEFFSKGILSPIAVQNAKPTLTIDGRVCRAARDVTGESDDIIYLNSSNTPIQVAIGEADPITWSADDVANDLKAGIKVTIVDQYGSHPNTVYNTDDQFFTPSFKYAGPTTVTFTGTDKDGGSIQAVRFYTIKATRQLSLTAVGPSDGNGSPHANYYRGAGRGEGHVYADAKCTGALAFSFDYNCGLAAAVKATAQGYRVGDIDNGTLKKSGSMGDIPITPDGSLATGEPYFTYAGNRDSFFYVWVRDVTDKDGKFTSEIYGDVSPEVRQAASATFTMPTDIDKETGAYPLSQYEAIFSREFLWTDNIGDINADAIPDIYALGYKGFGVSGEDQTDMTNLSQYNDDEDYFPFVFSDNAGGGIFLPAEEWEANSKKFTARLEIRGWGDHLNNAYQVLNAQGYAGSIPEYVATNVYTNPAVDTNSTLTAVEYDAWVQAGRDPNWSPERPTDPTKADTDGDNMPDGYEYYIWYKAHVGWIDDSGEHRYLTGRKYNPANPYDPTEITSATIASRFDPLSNAGSDWDTRDTDDDGLTDYAEYILGTDPFNYDTDNDGLPDGYEVAFTETDPMNADTNDNGIGDGAENPDNDSIAEISKDMFLVSAIGANGTEYYCCDGAKRDDFTVKPSETTHTGTIFMVGDVTLVTTRDWASSTYTNDNDEVCLRPGFNARNTWQCGDLEGKLVRAAEPTAEQLKTGTVVTLIQEGAEFYDQNLTSESTVVGTWYAAYPYQGGYARGGRADMEEVMRKAVMTRSFLGVKLLHYQVYQEKGFHSSTGWIHPPSGGVDTRSFTSMDEFLSMVFFHKTGSLSEADLAVTPQHSRIWIWQHYSTHPTNADTDGDMMPDGWEFYVMANTGDKGPTWHYSPLFDFRRISDGQTQDNDGDLLTWPHEYSGTGSSSRYGWTPLKPTWRNKAEPTDPWNVDTDEDGIKDGFEGGYGSDGATIGKIVAMNFMYNTTGTSGGGLNPLSWDTDSDGLPDPWEVEFHGTYTPGSSTTVVTQETSIGDDGTTNNVTRAVTTTVGCTWNMDGMNATVTDALVDYDHDGLANWQEYMVGTMRCWRYDDPESGWGVHRASATELEAILELGPGTDEWNEYWGERLVNKDGEKYNPHFANGYFDAGAAYFSCCRKPFDPANGNYYYLYDGIYHEQATDMTWGAKAILEFGGDMPYIQTAPKRYICCDPRNSDTDYDGMDDYYELFHGMNPMLGMPATGDNGRQPCDIVYDAYNRSFLDPARESATGVSALNNWWRNDKKPHTTGMATGIKHAEIGGYDFVANPWLNGIASADPDGDNIVNQEEAIMPKVQAASTYHHTDPTPLWMTDSAYTNSLTRRYYRVSAPQGESSLTSWGWTFAQEPTFLWKGVTYKLSDFPGFTYKANTGSLSFSYRLDTFFGSYAWYCSFEENEGYDSDHDYLSDYEEGQGKTKNASDPQNHDDPLRRQAMYFNGVDAFLETPVATREWDPDSPDSSTEARQNFLYYTVECWAKPDEASIKNDNTVRTLVERAIWADNASAADETLMRKNFLIGIKGGRWYTCFDSSGTDIQPVEITDGPVATTNWTHIAATYDGTALRLYVNGICYNDHATSIQPEHGVAALALDAAGEMNPTGGTIGQATDEHDESFIAILVGASAKTKNGIVFDSAWRYRNYLYASATNPEGLYTNATTIADYHNFYKGYIDEVRIWDGARSAVDIQADVDNRVRYAADLAIENREAVYAKWRIGGLRSPASNIQLPPQLMYHWSFDQIAGAVSPEDVIKVPAGFDTDKTVLNAKARWSRPADYVERNWNSSAVRSTIYTDNAWVPWINNTVAHLPRFDLTTLDSIYWSENYAGSVSALTNGYTRFGFPRTAEVYSRWTQRTYNGSSVFYCIYLDPDFNYLNGVDGVHGVSSAFSCALTDQRSRWDVVSGYGSAHLTPQTKDYAATQTELAKAFRFALRDRNTCGDDILPMGGAYPRRISSAEGGMWDNKQGEEPSAADAWAETGNDADNNGLPDWWEEYARQNYCQGLSPEDPLNWDTTVTYHGVKMPAYQAYLRDLASGMVKIGSYIGFPKDSEGNCIYADTRDTDKDGLPDWWEELSHIDPLVANGEEDADNDGLSNRAEYLAYKKTGADFNAGKSYSVMPHILDYFVKAADGKYVGESLDADGNSLIADHDFMEDAWEDMWDPMDVFPYSLYANRYVYDANLDADEDGWKNWSECRAYHWGCGYFSDIIDNFIGGNVAVQLRCFPRPAIGLHITYNGRLDPSWKSLVVRTWTANSTYPDAIFQINSMQDAGTTDAGGMEKTQILGVYNNMPIMRGYLNPGLIVPSSVYFEMTRVDCELTYHWHCTKCDGLPKSGSYEAYSADLNEHGEAKTDPNNLGVTLDYTNQDWQMFAMAKGGSDGRHGTIYLSGTDTTEVGTEVGTIDYRTGEFSINLEKIAELDDRNFDGMVFRANYTYALGAYWPQTICLNTPERGYVKEGENTIEAFFDLNGNYVYDIGEPYGRISHVNIGWHKVPEVRLTLGDGIDNGIPLFEIQSSDAQYDVEQSAGDQKQQITDGTIKPAILNVAGAQIATSAGGDGGESAVTSFTLEPEADGKGCLRIFRTSVTSVTGVSNACVRTVYSRNIDVTYGKVYTVADFILPGQIDLDSRYLVSDVQATGMSASDIREVEYAVCWGNKDSITPLYTFTRTFDLAQIAPTLDMAYTNSYYKLLKAQPEFTWKGREGYGAFAVQVSEKEDFSTILYAATNILPQVDTTGGYTFKPDLYVGEALKDKTTYYWRVAQLNAKFTTNVWSKVASFSTAVNSKNVNTGYGKLAAEVRYYGPSDVATSNVIVGVYEAGDFCCAPVARTRLVGDKPISALTNEADRAFATITTNVVFDGIAPGEYYVMAFADGNGNGVRDAYETWGYVCKIATEETDLWTPVATTVTSTLAAVPRVLIVMEDTDVNQNMTPDCLEDMTGWNPDPLAVDTDGDGISDYEELNEFGTDPNKADTDGDGISDYEEVFFYITDPNKADSDGDGMFDGWEVRLGSNPQVPDPDLAGAEDMMAYAEMSVKVLVATNGTANTAFVVREETDLASGQITNNVLYTTFQNDGKTRLYVGRPLTAAEKTAATNRYGYAYVVTNVVAMHSAVYDFYGYDATTARTGETNAVNTKAFTALDKYLTQKYYLAEFEGGAATNDFALSVAKLDSNANYIPDGWELYVRYAENSPNKVFPIAKNEEMGGAFKFNYDPWVTVDGVPNLWKLRCGVNPASIRAAASALAGDVMAFAKCDAVLVAALENGVTNTYLLADGKAVVRRGDDIPLNRLRTTYAYPVIEGEGTNMVSRTFYGIGTNLTSMAKVRVLNEPVSVTAVLVHKQVYDEFGFDTKTCVADEDAVNTKAFTTIDKYLVVRYLDAMGKIAYDKTQYASGEEYVNANGLWEHYTLKPYEIDNDVDGIADGWELYTGLNPWNYDDARQQSKGGEGLTNLQEYDGGYCPTDPNNGDTDGDNVSDKFAYQYHLKGGDAGLDNDGDGLSNYAEYLISEVFKFAMLDPDNPKTDGSCVDYFRKVGDLYFGEVFTDHDQVNDVWEQEYNAFANRGVYDPLRDDDEDGWSNWAEAQAGTHPGTDAVPGADGEKLLEVPVPTIAATVVYKGSKPLTGNLVFQAWNEDQDPGMTGSPDAAWVASAAAGATNITKYVGLNPGETMTYHLGTGAVSPGSLRVWFRDTAAMNVTLYSNGVTTVSTATNPQWYYFVADSQVDNYLGDLLLCVTNMAAVKVGSVNYSTGLVTIDFGSDALQQKVIDQWINGMDASGAAKSTGIAASAVQIDLARSFVKLAWKPSNFAFANGAATYYLSDCAAEPANWGRVLEGKNKFTVFCDVDGGTDNQWDPGEPFGFVQDVDIGWQGGAFTVEISEVSPVFARVNLLAAEGETATDREYYQPGASAVVDVTQTNSNPVAKLYRKGLTELRAVPLDGKITPGNGMTLIRVVRAFVDGDWILGYNADATRKIPVGKALVMKKYINLEARGYLHEGDFLSAGAHDVGWAGLKDTLESKVYGPDGKTPKFIEGTNVTYMIVIGGSENDDDLYLYGNGSNMVFRCLINKNYDSLAARMKGATDAIRPRIDTTTPGIVYGAKPTFRWAMKDGKGDDFNSYTAFELEICPKGGGEALYTSGVRDIPPVRKDASGVWYEWQLDRSIESILGTSGEYTWRVAMYNAKFKDAKYRGYDVALWSDYGSLVVDLNRQQPMNDHVYSSIAAAVKYAGPMKVLEQLPAVRLQAFETADYAGLPVGESFVTDYVGLVTTAHVVSNACVHGLFQTGTYYLKAFIDSNGNGVQDDFESWGGASKPVTITKDTLTVPTVGIYIEDADTDGDWIPDAYEYALHGNLTAINGEVIGLNTDKIRFVGTIAAAVDKAGVSTGLSGASLTIFQNGTYAKLVSGNLNTTVSINDIRAAVEKKINPKTVKITALSLAPDGKKVTLSVAAEVTDSIAGELLGKVYDMTGVVGDTATVTVKVYRKETLAEAGWTLVDTVANVAVGKGVAQIDVPVNGIDMTSGFYKIEIEQKK